ncbi:hypothetical protein ACIGXF_32295 [Streptomyces sp. NPDC053086]|uniref:hypothetical protein n=1 Tax=unclassified Streptomyces TaxID=2593676 RepID=UPI0037D18D21
MELLQMVAFVLLHYCHPLIVGTEMMRLIKGWIIFFRPEPLREPELRPALQPQRREVQPETPDGVVIHAPRGAAKKIKITIEWGGDDPDDPADSQTDD